ncbi:hypothetical protein BH10ACI2_BH10ACI2_16290 [soil metagenome]
METNLEKLKRITAWDVEPTLSEDDLASSLDVAAIADLNGLAPINEEWDPTYDLNAAAADAWLTKAARAAATVDTPTAGFVTSRVFDNCRAMARMYAGRKAVSVNVR